MLPLGYFDTHTGELRRAVDGCAASIETLLAHMLPDIALAPLPWSWLARAVFALDALGRGMPHLGGHLAWRHGRHDGRQRRREFMKAYMGALVKMNKTGTEYVRGIPRSRCFSRTVYPLRPSTMRLPNTPIWHKTIRARSVEARKCSILRRRSTPVAFFLPVALLLAPGETDFCALFDKLHLLRDFFGRGAHSHDRLCLWARRLK